MKPNKTKDQPHPVDLHVGVQLRTQRLLRGLSQTALAESVGVTFQQIQKYERGTNRISASMLMEIAHVLNVPISSFFKDYERTDGEPSNLNKGVTSGPQLMPESVELAQLFSRISDGKRRRHVLDLIRNLAADGARA